MKIHDDPRLRRVGMRCWRRGTREMDLILGHFADTALDRLDPATLDSLEAMLEENDNDLFLWVTGAAEAPAEFGPLLQRIRAEMGPK